MRRDSTSAVTISIGFVIIIVSMFWMSPSERALRPSGSWRPRDADGLRHAVLLPAAQHDPDVAHQTRSLRIGFRPLGVPAHDRRQRVHRRVACSSGTTARTITTPCSPSTSTPTAAGWNAEHGSLAHAGLPEPAIRAVAENTLAQQASHAGDQRHLSRLRGDHLLPDPGPVAGAPAVPAAARRRQRRPLTGASRRRARAT